MSEQHANDINYPLIIILLNPFILGDFRPSVGDTQTAQFKIP